MSSSTEPKESGIGLALSGGGYRATLFHVGSLWRLNELAYLPKLDRISSVSGGSITSGYLGIQWHALTFSSEIATNFDDVLVQPLRRFCKRTIDIPAILLGLFIPWKGPSYFVEKSYRKYLFKDATLQDLPDHPRFIFNATNFKTGVTFRFSKPYAGDYRIGLIYDPQFPVAMAVAASSSFPPLLSPVKRTLDPNLFTKTKGADLYDQVIYRKKQKLTDGGVYDNLGLETIYKRYDTILASDAGAPFSTERTFGSLWTNQALRVLEIVMNQALALRKRELISSYISTGRKGTYWGIATDITDYETPESLPVKPAKIKELSHIRTRLNHFTEKEQCELINWGYAVCDAAMRRYVIPSSTKKPSWPYPKFALDRK